MNEIYFDLTDVENTEQIALAIKVVSQSFEKVKFNVSIKSEISHTLYNKKNIELINGISNDFKVLCTTKYEKAEDDYTVKMLKSYEKDKTTFIIEIPNDAKDYDKYFNSFNELEFLKDGYKYGVLSVNDVVSNDFIMSHEQDENFIGLIEPTDICKQNIDLLLTSIDVSKVFISTLLYTIEFINKKNEKPKKEGYFAKFFGNLSGSSTHTHAETINYLLEEVDIIINKDKQIIFVFEKEKSYATYFNLINRICNILYN